MILSIVNHTAASRQFEGLPNGGIVRAGVGVITTFSIDDADFIEQAINAGLSAAVNAGDLSRPAPR